MSKWTEETMVKFVEQYLLHECLWNFRNSAYKNKQTRQNAVAQIVENMHINDFGVKEVNKKIKSIRSTYSQEVRRVRESNKSGAGVDEIYKPNVKWFPILDNALKSVNINDLMPTQDNMQNGNDNEDTVNGLGIGGEESINTEEASNSQSRKSEAQGQEETPRTQRKRRLQDLNAILDKVTNTSKLLNTPVTSVGEHEFDIFARSIAAQLKAMPLGLALQAQNHIQSHISQLRIQQFSGYSQPNDYRHSPAPYSFNNNCVPFPSPSLHSYTNYSSSSHQSSVTPPTSSTSPPLTSATATLTPLSITIPEYSEDILSQALASINDV